MTFQELYLRYCNAVAFLEVEKEGTIGVGTAFHIGDGIYLTAKHVVEGQNIKTIETTTRGYYFDPKGNAEFNGVRYKQFDRQKGRLVSGPHYNDAGNDDVALIVVDGIDAPTIPISAESHDYMFDDDEIALSKVLVMGYPPVPFADGPRLFAAKGEINTVIDKYTDPNPYFIISTMARGGFSGGPCIAKDGSGLGIITESLVYDNKPAETGYMSVTTAKAIYRLLLATQHIPKEQEENISIIYDNFRIPSDEAVN